MQSACHGVSAANRRGLTLVEVLVVTLIFGVVGGILLTVAASGQSAWWMTDAQLLTLTETQRALDRVSEDLRQACQTTVSCPAGQLVFKQSPACADPAITYSLSGTNLTRQVGTAVPVTIATGVTGFAVPSCAGGLVNLSLTAQARTPNGRTLTQTISSQVWVQTS